MSNTIVEFTVPAVPVSQPRPRAVIRGSHAGVHEQTTIKNADGSRKPHPIVAFKATVRMAAQEAYQGPPLEGPLRCDVLLVFPRTKGQTWKKKPMPRLPHEKKPDRDNCDKAIMDALSKLLWVDDSQVCDGRIKKVIAAGDEQPRVFIRVSRVTEV